MAYSTKKTKTLVSVVASMILAVIYLIYVTGNKAPGINDLKSWAVAILIFIGIGVVLQIVIQIILQIVYSVSTAVRETGIDDKEIERIVSSEMYDDEMDKLINLKSAHIGYILVGVGFIAALIVIATGCPVIYALHILFGSYLASSVAEGLVAAYLYERGVHNG